MKMMIEMTEEKRTKKLLDEDESTHQPAAGAY